MEYLICKLIEHISKNMAVLSVVDEDYGQLEALENENVDMYPLTFPAVLIETPETEWGDITDGGQKGACTIRIRLVIDCYDDTHASSGTVAAVSKRNELRHRLHALLQGFRPDGDGALCAQNQSSSRGTTASRCTKRHTPLPYRKMSLWEKRPFSVRKSCFP